MEEKQLVLPGFDLPEEVTGESAAHRRWLQDLGREVEALAYMMRKPTEERPFVYEVRIDLIPAKNNDAVLIAKAFGKEQAMCAFFNASGLLQLLRGFSGQMKAGKTKWYSDQYSPNNYEKRLERFTSGEFYRV